MDTTRIPDATDSRDAFADETWTGCESVIKAFEQAWHRGPAPDIDHFLLADGPDRVSLLIELVHADLEFRLKAGEKMRVEAYLSRYPELAENAHAVIDLIAAEYELRLRQGRVDAAEYASRFPAYAGEFPARFADVERLVRSARRRPPAVHPPLVPGYQIVAEIGRGGMGVVYQACDSRLGRHVALKFIPPELAGDEVLLERFRREAQTASSLNHPHICTVHALGEHLDRPFIVLEFIEGQTLKALAAQRLEISELIRIIRQVCSALAAAHAAGVVHRDIKPENIMVRPDRYVKVLDFGLARRLPTLGSGTAPGTQDTWPGTVLGTVAYMSPEQARGEALTGASDIFSLGIVLYLLLTGQHPFERGSPFETLRAIADDRPPPASRWNPAVPASLDGLIEAMLHKDQRLRPSAIEVEAALAAAARNHRPVATAIERRIVRRQPELSVLRRASSDSQAGRGLLVCVAGEPGIGKTTLVEDFLDELAQQGDTRLIARGRCSERQSAVAAYLPVIDALADLLRSNAGSSVARLMEVVAPSWYAQVALSQVADNAAPARASTQQAMLREFTTLLADLARLGPVVLFFDDVHWADLSTVDLLAYLFRHGESLPVLVLVTYRPTEMLLGPHPFHGVKLELQGKGICTDLALGFLERSEIDRYLSLAFPNHAFPPDFADFVHSRTEGSPLFMVDLLRDLCEGHVIAAADGRWSLARALPELWLELPETVRSMIQRKLERLDDGDRRLLGAAAAQGHEFDSAVVAAAIEFDPAAVEERMQLLERVHGLVRLLREDEFPDRTLTMRYAFVHALYQQALYADLSPTRRTAISRALAQSLESHYGDESASAAAQLACLYEAGRDFLQGARQFHQAAQNAAQVFAHRDAVQLARRGLGLLQGMPRSATRDALELSLQTTLGLQLQVTEGYGSEPARLAYNRARELCVAGPPTTLFSVLWGLWLVYKVRSELTYAQEIADELLALAMRLHDPNLALQAHQALGLTALCRGQPATSLRHIEQVATLYHPERHRTHAFLFGQDPGVICKAYGAVALWLLGYPDAAVRQSEHAIEMSQDLSPTSQAVALHFAAMVYQLCRRHARSRQCAEASVAISSEHGFPFWLAGGTVIAGWAAAMDERNEGIERLRRGINDWHATGSVTYLTYYLGLLADVLNDFRDVEERRRIIDEAISLASRTDERLYEAELYRLRGETFLHPDGDSSTSASLAQRDFDRALEIAFQQEARALELRAAISLARLQRTLGSDAPARQRLSEIIEFFAEGSATPDLAEARALVSGA